MESLRDFFKPEFLNRLDDIVVFDSLSRIVISDIVLNQLDLVTKRLKKKEIHLSYSKKLINYLAEKGFDPKYGARPLKRLIQNEILNTLALEMINEKIKPGAKVMIDFEKEKVVFKGKSPLIMKKKKSSCKEINPEVYFFMLICLYERNKNSYNYIICSSCYTCGFDKNGHYPKCFNLSILNQSGGGYITAKPIIYLYPEDKTEVTVNLDYKGNLIADYPSYDNDVGGWQVLAYPNGTLFDMRDNQEYSYIFWEGDDGAVNWDMPTGFIVPGSDSRAF